TAARRRAARPAQDHVNDATGERRASGARRRPGTRMPGAGRAAADRDDGGRAHGQAGCSVSAHALGQLLLGLAAVIALARLLGTLAKLAGQPPVIGEILAGVLVGPTFFGTAI